MLTIPGRIDVAGDLSLLYVDMNNTAIKRQQAALVIANISGAIKRINEMKYVVKSQSDNGDCDVCSTDSG
jgi:hypothetical protein